MTTAIEHIKAERLRPLAVTTATRVAGLPSIPAIGEHVPGYDASAWLGVGAPRETPPAIIDTLNQAINACLADPRMVARLAELSVPPTRFACLPDHDRDCPSSTGGYEPWSDQQVALAERHARPHLARIITLASNTG